MLPHSKSYTSIYEIFGSSPFNDVLYKIPYETDKERLFYSRTCGDSEKRSDNKESINCNLTEYVTSENYHHLNKDVSYKSVVQSNSTIFYDLDEIAKRHSFHCLTKLSISNANLLKVVKIPVTKNAFGVKSEAVVQECATKIQPKLIPCDSIDINIRRGRKKNDRDMVLSSEIFLRDEEYTHDYDKNHYYEKNISDKHQKFWSYAKYRTEYTNPVTEGKKHKKKEKEKQVEDPCPCQLFSYVCPCTGKKSLTELAKSNKSLIVIDQVTSTSNFFADDSKETKKKAPKKQKRQKPKEEKPTSITPIETTEDVPNKNTSLTQIIDNNDSPRVTDAREKDQGSVKNKQKPYKKPRKIICPNCKEKVEVVSITEDEEILKCNYSTSGSKEISSTAAYACRPPPHKSYKGKIEDDGDKCFHEPRCELVPVCQILPCDDNYSNSKSKTQSNPRTNARVIRITKACRHHPPCTVVPSCQKANVLKNNCEYIPPCLHRPRCVNLPLCVPFSKSMHYEEVNKHVDEKENDECPHIPRCKYIPVCQHDSLVSNVNHQIHMVPQMQHACEFMNGYQTPAFLITPHSNCMPSSFSPCQEPSPNTCSYKSTKSCQYDCIDNTCYTFSIPKESESNDMVVFIRDVGCQFRNNNYSARESVMQSKVSSGSIDYVDVKMDKYYTNIHTLRYEDKFTNPISRVELSISSGSISSSVEVKNNFTSRDNRGIRESLRSRQTGFSPDVAYVAAFNTHGESTSTTGFISSNNIKEVSKCTAPTYRGCHNAPSVKSHRSFLNYKHRRLFINRRKKCKSSKHININRSK